MQPLTDLGLYPEALVDVPLPVRARAAVGDDPSDGARPAGQGTELLRLEMLRFRARIRLRIQIFAHFEN